MGRKSKSISIEAERDYIDAVAVVGQQRGFKTTAAFVRDVMDKAHGVEIQQVLKKFAASGYYERQLADDSHQQGGES